MKSSHRQTEISVCEENVECSDCCCRLVKVQNLFSSKILKKCQNRIVRLMIKIYIDSVLAAYWLFVQAVTALTSDRPAL